MRTDNEIIALGKALLALIMRRLKPRSADSVAPQALPPPRGSKPAGIIDRTFDEWERLRDLEHIGIAMPMTHRRRRIN
jgi:hypothetical protein